MVSSSETLRKCFLDKIENYSPRHEWILAAAVLLDKNLVQPVAACSYATERIGQEREALKAVLTSLPVHTNGVQRFLDKNYPMPMSQSIDYAAGVMTLVRRMETYRDQVLEHIDTFYYYGYFDSFDNANTALRNYASDHWSQPEGNFYPTEEFLLESIMYYCLFNNEKVPAFNLTENEHQFTVTDWKVIMLFEIIDYFERMKSERFPDDKNICQHQGTLIEHGYGWSICQDCRAIVDHEDDIDDAAFVIQNLVL